MLSDAAAGHGWDPAAWIALAVFAFSLLTSVASLAFVLGKHSNRLKVLEDKDREKGKELEKVKDEVGAGRAQYAALDATLGALDRTVGEGFRRLEAGIRDALVEARAGRRPRASAGD